jgi:hypothetical protein
MKILSWGGMEAPKCLKISSISLKTVKKEMDFDGMYI